jgi:hypothetical protein
VSGCGTELSDSGQSTPVDPPHRGQELLGGPGPARLARAADLDLCVRVVNLLGNPEVVIQEVQSESATGAIAGKAESGGTAFTVSGSLGANIRPTVAYRLEGPPLSRRAAAVPHAGTELSLSRTAGASDQNPGRRSKALEYLVHVAVLVSRSPCGMTGGEQLDRFTNTIYGYYMSTRKTTVYLDADAYRRLQQLAREQGRPTAELVREAVAEYADRHRPRSRPRSIGSMRSGLGDLAERAEEHLEDFGSE